MILNKINSREDSFSYQHTYQSLYVESGFLCKINVHDTLRNKIPMRVGKAALYITSNTGAHV